MENTFQYAEQQVHLSKVTPEAMQVTKKYGKASVIANVEGANKLCELSWVIRRGIIPIYNVMKMCGLTYGSTCPLMRQIGVRHKVERAYTIGVASFIMLSLLRIVPCLFKSSTSYPSFIKYEYFLLNLKSAIQAFFCIYIGHRYGREMSRLQELVHAYDEQIACYFSSADEKPIKRFLKTSRIIFYILLTTSLATIVLTMILMFSSKFDKEPAALALYEPFTNPSLPIKIIYLAGYAYLTVSWLLPVNLYCALCMSLSLLFSQFLSSVKSFECHTIRYRIKYIREEYQKLSELVTRTDDTMSFMAFCVYFLDVALCCFHLYHLFYFTDGNAFKAMAPAYRVFVSIASLFFTSFCASKVVDKGQHISQYVAALSAEDVDLESHAQLVMLLHEIGINPISLTIWKLVPLYKSIIISVFVSLITYFTLLMQFKSGG